MQLTLVQRIQHAEPGANEDEGVPMCTHIIYIICLVHCNHQVAEWIGYYQTVPIIYSEYINYQVAIMYGNINMLYGGTKI